MACAIFPIWLLFFLGLALSLSQRPFSASDFGSPTQLGQTQLPTPGQANQSVLHCEAAVYGAATVQYTATQSHHITSHRLEPVAFGFGCSLDSELAPTERGSAAHPKTLPSGPSSITPLACGPFASVSHLSIPPSSSAFPLASSSSPYPDLSTLELPSSVWDNPISLPKRLVSPSICTCILPPPAPSYQTQSLSGLTTSPCKFSAIVFLLDIHRSLVQPQLSLLCPILSSPNIGCLAFPPEWANSYRTLSKDSTEHHPRTDHLPFPARSCNTSVASRSGSAITNRAT